VGRRARILRKFAGGPATEGNFVEDVVVVGDQSLGKTYLDSMAITP